MEVNSVFVAGNLTQTPQINKTNTGTPVTTFTVANNRNYTKKDSEEKQQETVFLDVTVWGKQGEICAEYLSKGSKVLVQGRLKQDNWTDKTTGQNRSKICIVADRVHFVGAYGKDREQSSENYDNQVAF